MTATKTDTVTLPLVRAIETAWKAIQSFHPEIPEVVVTLASGQHKTGVNAGHFQANAWVRGEEELHELFVGGEGLEKGPLFLLDTLLHEAAHSLGKVREINNTSRGGRYHNDNFRTLAMELGLDVQKNGKNGWDATTVSQELQTKYSRTVRSLREALSAYRKTELPEEKRPSSNNGRTLECQCEKPRKIRASLTVIELGSITCGVCEHEFKVNEPEEIPEEEE